MMNKLLAFFPLLVLLASGSCKKVDELTEFDISYSSEAAIPGSPYDTSGAVDFLIPDIKTESSTKFAAGGTSKDFIDGIYLKSLTITNQSGDLDFMDAMSVFISADGLPEVLLASKINFPKGTNSVVLDPGGNNIKEYIFKDAISLRLGATVNSLRPEEQKLKIDQVMRVSGKKLSKK